MRMPPADNAAAWPTVAPRRTRHDGLSRTTGVRRRRVTAALVTDASCERRLALEFRLPTLDCFVSDLLAAALDGIDREAVDHVEDICRDALGDLQDPSQRFRRKHRRLTQRRIAQDRRYQGFELFIRGPPAQSELLKPARKLNVAADRLPRLVDTETDERDLQPIAQEA